MQNYAQGEAVSSFTQWGKANACIASLAPPCHTHLPACAAWHSGNSWCPELCRTHLAAWEHCLAWSIPCLFKEHHLGVDVFNHTNYTIITDRPLISPSCVVLANSQSPSTNSCAQSLATSGTLSRPRTLALVLGRCWVFPFWP